MRALRVRLPNRSYSILVGNGIINRAGHLIKKAGITQRTALIVSQREILPFLGDKLRQSLEKEGFEVSIFTPPPAKSSEAAKSEAVYAKLLKHLVSIDGSGKSVMLVALGGGVIGDVTGFAASVYRRGVPYIQIPTTLTAQVDSAIGGKTGIDLPEGKNLIGTIYQPSLVLSDLEALNSLPARQWSDGSAEVIKYGVIKDPALFSTLEKQGKDGLSRNRRLLEKVIFRCARIKAKIVEKDELDRKDLRIILNFGHTTGHAIEAASRFSRNYTHGEAVAIGMLAACDISESLKVLRDNSLKSRLENTLVKFSLPVFFKGLSVDTILKAIGYDKKSQAGSNRFVLPVTIGRTMIYKNVPQDVIRHALENRRG